MFDATGTVSAILDSLVSMITSFLTIVLPLVVVLSVSIALVFKGIAWIKKAISGK